TGETGAGKSILLGALGLIMGKRADIKSLYDLEQKCIIEATFDIQAYKLKSFFEKNDLDYFDELQIRREITPSGKSRAFVNDSPANLNVLQTLSNALIDLHQQFDTLDIHEVSFQLRLIDALAGNRQVLDAYQQLFESYQVNLRRITKYRSQESAASKENDFLRFQLEELQEAALESEEQERLEEELDQLTNAEEIKRSLSAAFMQLSESEFAVISQLQEITLAIGPVKDVHPKLRTLFPRFEGLIFELEDLAKEFEQIADATEHDEERLQEVKDRLDVIYRLQKKHQVQSCAELLEIQRELEEQLGGFEDLSERIAALEKTLTAQEKELRTLALMLRETRQTVIPDFEQKVMQRLALLSMEHAVLKVQVHALDELGPTGLDDVQYLFAANKGSRLQHIKDVASGGELSRLTLVTKSLVASAIPLPTLIFDEIDTGISGDVALKMGRILRELSNEHQVVSITHSPQIAAQADAHYFVFKRVDEAEEKTYTNVKELSAEDRIYAIATMLSQNPPSDSAIENAKELLKYKEPTKS
ncbi:MAG: DNA repair protein RecN, partial [Phaeodactylibacter sp.]|nr:DNA repair protein RecN [Phaeodactylibacter sp.]